MSRRRTLSLWSNRLKGLLQGIQGMKGLTGVAAVTLGAHLKRVEGAGDPVGKASSLGVEAGIAMGGAAAPKAREREREYKVFSDKDPPHTITPVDGSSTRPKVLVLAAYDPPRTACQGAYPMPELTIPTTMGSPSSLR